MELGIRGRTAIVSGGSKGIGRATAELLARDGVNVAIAARGKEAIDEAVEAIRREGGSAVGIVADMRDAEDVERAVSTARDEFGPPDIAISNVHGPGPGDFFDLDADDFRSAFDDMVLSVVHLTRAVVPDMRKQHWGRLVNIGSGAAKEPPSDLRHALANTTRAPVVTLQKTLANELGPDGITVNTVGTGWIATQRMLDYSENAASEHGVSRDQFVEQFSAAIPLRRPGTPQEMAGLIAFLCSELAGYITGQWIAVDGGLLRSAF